MGRKDKLIVEMQNERIKIHKELDGARVPSTVMFNINLDALPLSLIDRVNLLIDKANQQENLIRALQGKDIVESHVL